MEMGMGMAPRISKTASILEDTTKNGEREWQLYTNTIYLVSYYHQSIIQFIPLPGPSPFRLYTQGLLQPPQPFHHRNFQILHHLTRSRVQFAVQATTGNRAIDEKVIEVLVLRRRERTLLRAQI